MARHQIRHDILLQSQLVVEPSEFIRKPFVHGILRLAHTMQNIIRNMFGRYPELSAHMVFQQLAEKGIVTVGHQIIKPYTRSYKNFFYTVYPPKLSQQPEIFTMVYLHIRTRLWEQTLPVGARAFCELLFTCRLTEICRRTSHVVDIALKVRVPCHKLRFPYHALVAP